MDEPATPQKPLTYEETPIIEPIKESTPQPASPPASTSTKPRSPGFWGKFFRFLLNFLGLIILFLVGVWFSIVLRQLVPTGVELTSTPTPTPTRERNQVATKSSDWKTYQVISSGTKQPVAGISFQLPSDVVAPICDGTSCASQGTYLPGGTRFTVAARGAGQGLRFIRGAVITDAGGRAFTTKEATVAGRYTLEYSGSFRGTTIGGYTFSQMRGVMIEVSTTLTLEFNHFSPSGVTVDFVSDDALFDKILETVELPVSVSPTVTYPTATQSSVSQ